MQVGNATQGDIQAVLAQMRALRTQAQAPLSATSDIAVTNENEVKPGGSTDFGAALKGAIDHVNGLQQTSSTTANNFLLGKENDLVKVMVDSQKASLGFQGLLQARNRMISAYQDIMNMPI